MKKIKSTFTRREFLKNSAKIAVAVSAAGMVSSLPVFAENKTDNEIARRRLGKTGLDVSILGFGGGSQFLMNPDGEWEKVMETAIEAGINIFDTAPSYSASSFNQGGAKSLDSEDRFGVILPKYREKIILSTKLESRNPEEAKSALEASLKRMKTDHVDILFIHGILPTDSTTDIEKGIYKTMASFKSSGMVKNIGFSSMDSAERSKELIEKLDFDVVLLAMNATKYGDFEKIALPAALKKNMGVIGMKAMRDIVGKNATGKELLEHMWSKNSVSSVFVGHNGLQIIQENIRLAKEFSKAGVSRVDRKELELRMAGMAGPHVLSWARPGYRDNGLA
jgi:aryl-alcohol dehydrogenase-like predicted oxidoreductase